MMKWFILFKKEFKESLRNFKWIWIPIVFSLLGIMQPVTSYFLPDILESFGGMPEGAFSIPLPTGPQVLAETLGQFSQIGYLVLVLSFMGTVASERNNATNIMVLVKPVSFASYITAKWVHMYTLALSSFVVGFVLAYYYTSLLIETVPFTNVLKGMMVYAVGILFVLTLVLFFSTLFKSTAAVAFLTLGITIIISLMSTFVPDIMKWSPGTLTQHSYSLFQTGTADGVLLPVLCTLFIIFALVGLAIYLFSKKELAVHTT
ncbi:ABC transporter permease [Evansella cellulosilytica]|uniref:ABC transporter permease n=1 Tax=Evansella cellulosilytica (strain ATCC 21833 / DSM 2522 / FERM P-1141 / JCM 9156 / N-4) TaxID=649639 RepID=E6U2B6_EVAC2|nr:ABC-2 transporter permease [Evansella cellulosilytica]ADU31629.1 hypothetical protein Bcell_3387 [Evansella cellulosilytica DSM 2522]